MRAKTRGIEFLFSFDEWIEWWEQNLGSDWFERRGRRRNQYVMARKGDEGPYQLDNVECILSGQNIRDAFTRVGPKKKLPPKSKRKRTKSYSTTGPNRCTIVFKTNIDSRTLTLYKFGSGSIIEKCEEPIVEGIIEAFSDIR